MSHELTLKSSEKLTELIERDSFCFSFAFKGGFFSDSVLTGSAIPTGNTDRKPSKYLSKLSLGSVQRV